MNFTDYTRGEKKKEKKKKRKERKKLENARPLKLIFQPNSNGYIIKFICKIKFGCTKSFYRHRDLQKLMQKTTTPRSAKVNKQNVESTIKKLNHIFDAYGIPTSICEIKIMSNQVLKLHSAVPKAFIGPVICKQYDVVIEKQYHNTAKCFCRPRDLPKLMGRVNKKAICRPRDLPKLKQYHNTGSAKVKAIS